ncbi:hypothetical protein EET67_22180 [Pseudaminobacter arsenicus]|uniref:Uncharacterized protein n=1 Tax=Borborobacter arsenicus TaxID=1851146 RepID=A0A432V0F7_9HYPH|nr:hypothetical protein [Pseudaminobacter arsenicus]RUM95659.1 hypothetical protein EET67_22180 [Pseudaminobacter arsenicus]
MHSLKVVGVQVNAGAVLSHIIGLQRASGMLATMKRHAREVNAAVNEAAGQDIGLLASVLADFPPVHVDNQEFPDIYRQTVKYAHFARVFTDREQLAEFAGPNDAKAILAFTEPLKERHTTEREAAKQAIDDWGKVRQRIIDESDTAFNTYRNGLEALKPAKALWYDIAEANGGLECYFVHPVTRKRAFTEEKFSRCLLASIEHGWWIAKRFTRGGYGDAMIGGPLSPNSELLNAGIFPSGYAWASDFNETCVIFTPDGRIANLPGLDKFDRFLSCGDLSNKGKKIISLRTYENECLYFRNNFDVVERYSLGKNNREACREFNE